MTIDEIRGIIKNAKSKKRVTWEAVADDANLSKDSVYAFLNGARDGRINTLLSIVDALGLEVVVRRRVNNDE